MKLLTGSRYAQASEDISKNLFQMKGILYGDGGAFVCPLRASRELMVVRAGGLENEPQPEIIAQLAQEVYQNDILQLLLLHIWRFEFEVSIRPRRSTN
jgi:calcium binding protein 39